VDVVHGHERSAAQTLEWLLGSANLRASWRTGMLAIRELVPLSPTPEELRELALSTYSGALRSFPDAESGAAAAFAKASIFEGRGDVLQAIAGYESLARAFPHSAQAPEGLIRSARMLFARGDYESAGNRFADVLRLGSQTVYETEARLGFANCLAHQDQFRTALRLIAALDLASPPGERRELHQRLLVRARCVLGDGNATGARKLLAEAENGGLELELEAEFYELSARALPADAAPTVAARVWMEHARRASGSMRSEAVREAARLTRLSGDELSALWIDRWAQVHGAGDAASSHAQAAREALGLDSRSLSTDPAEDRLARAERLVRARLWAEGHSALRALREQGLPLDEAAQTRMYLGLARCLHGLERVDDAISMLREGLELVREADRRREFYLCAGTIFEDSARIDDAIDAYRGRL
jgi:tetratricopeptide (TPR) repeat protein